MLKYWFCIQSRLSEPSNVTETRRGLVFTADLITVTERRPAGVSYKTEKVQIKMPPCLTMSPSDSAALPA